MGGASLGRVFVMASLRFGQSKEPSQLMAPEGKRDGSFDVIFGGGDSTRAIKRDGFS